jgi:hypothetical protein
MSAKDISCYFRDHYFALIYPVLLTSIYECK